MDSQTTLLNFSKASLVKTFDSKLILSKNNVLHTELINCPTCNTKCIYNGYSHKGIFGSTLKTFQEKTFNVIKHFRAFLKLKKLRKKGLSLLKEIPPDKHLFAQMLIFTFQH